MTDRHPDAAKASHDHPLHAPQTPPLVLASASPRRRELLTALGLPFTISAADVDESVRPDEPVTGIAPRLARMKAEAVAALLSVGLVLGADTVVILDDRVLGKPVDPDDARAMLRALRGRRHDVSSAVWLHDVATGRGAFAIPFTAVWMRDYGDDEIEESIASGTPFDKAGAYAIQDDVFAPVERIDGCYCNVVGLPLWNVAALLRAAGPDAAVRPPSETRPVCGACPLRDGDD